MLNEIIVNANDLAKELGILTTAQTVQKRKEFVLSSVVEFYAKELMKQIRDRNDFFSKLYNRDYHCGYIEVSKENNPHNLTRDEAEEVFKKLEEEFDAAGYNVKANTNYSKNYKMYAYIAIQL